MSSPVSETASSTAPAPRQGGSRLGYVDSIRGVAALAVIYLHMARHFVGTGLLKDGPEYAAFFVSAYVFDLGKVAVALFFAVSGFVVPFSLLRGKEHPIRDFCISRFFRLYPAYWLSIPLGAYLFFHLRGEPFGVPQVLANMTMLQQFMGQPNAIGVYWTLQLELIFYALCVAMFLIGRLREPRFVMGIALAMLFGTLAVAGARFVTAKNLPVAIPLSLTVMLLGLLWRFALVEGDALARRYATWLAAALVLLLPAISVLAYNRDTGLQETWYRYTLSYYAALLLFFVLTTRWRLHAPAFQFLGRISYSVYLLGAVMQELLFLAAPPERFRAVPAHVYVVATMALTIVAATLAYRFVEKPSIAIGRRIAARLDHGARRTSPATEVI